MAVDFSYDIKTTERQMSKFVRRGQKVPKDVLAHYTNLLSGTLNAQELENGESTDFPPGNLNSSFPSITTSNSVPLAADTNRNYILLQNIGDQTIYINFDGVAAVGGGLQILPGGSWTSQIPQFVEAALNAIAQAGTSILAIYVIGE